MGDETVDWPSLAVDHFLPKHKNDYPFLGNYRPILPYFLSLLFKSLVFFSLLLKRIIFKSNSWLELWSESRKGENSYMRVNWVKFYNNAWLYVCVEVVYENMIRNLLINHVRACMILYMCIKWVSCLWYWANVSPWVSNSREIFCAYGYFCMEVYVF